MKLCVKWTFLAYGNDLQHSLGQKKEKTLLNYGKCCYNYH